MAPGRSSRPGTHLGLHLTYQTTLAPTGYGGGGGGQAGGAAGSLSLIMMSLLVLATDSDPAF